MSNSSVYITKAGDIWDIISFKVYGNEKFVLDLIKENPEFSAMAIFPANVYIKCPEIKNIKEGELPPW